MKTKNIRRLFILIYVVSFAVVLLAWVVRKQFADISAPSTEERRASLAQLGELRIGGESANNYLRARCHCLVALPAGTTATRTGSTSIQWNAPEGTAMKGLGSCTSISADGYLLTAAHCLVDGSQPVVVGRGTMTRARLVWKAPAPADLALLKAEEDIVGGLPLEKSSSAEAGWLFFPLGSAKEMPQGTALVSAGVEDGNGNAIDLVAGTLQEIEEVTEEPHILWLASDLPLVKGNSGGPIIGTDGQLLAIAVGGRRVLLWKELWRGRIKGKLAGVGHAVSPAFIMGLIEEDRRNHPSAAASEKPPN